jgi:hypothetical protein
MTFSFRDHMFKGNNEGLKRDTIRELDLRVKIMVRAHERRYNAHNHLKIKILFESRIRLFQQMKQVMHIDLR